MKATRNQEAQPLFEDMEEVDLFGHADEQVKDLQRTKKSKEDQEHLQRIKKQLYAGGVDEQNFYNEIKLAIKKGQSCARWGALARTLLALFVLTAAVGIAAIAITSGAATLGLGTTMIEAFQAYNYAMLGMGIGLTFISALSVVGSIAAFHKSAEKSKELREQKDDIKFTFGLAKA